MDHAGVFGVESCDYQVVSEDAAVFDIHSELEGRPVLQLTFPAPPKEMHPARRLEHPHQPVATNRKSRRPLELSRPRPRTTKDLSSGSHTSRAIRPQRKHPEIRCLPVQHQEGSAGTELSTRDGPELQRTRFVKYSN